MSWYHRKPASYNKPFHFVQVAEDVIFTWQSMCFSPLNMKSSNNKQGVRDSLEAIEQFHHMGRNILSGDRYYQGAKLFKTPPLILLGSAILCPASDLDSASCTLARSFIQLGIRKERQETMPFQKKILACRKYPRIREKQMYQ